MKKFLTIQLDSSELNPAQERLIRYMNSMLLSALTSKDEGEYFESSNEAMRMLASLIRRANFNESTLAQAKDIPYETQVLEYCMETINDDIIDNKTVIFDN